MANPPIMLVLVLFGQGEVFEYLLVALSTRALYAS